MRTSPRAEAAIIGLSAGFALLGGFAAFFMPVFLKEDLGFSGAAIGLLYGALSLTSLASCVPAGVCSDRRGSRGLLLSAILLTALTLTGLAASRALWLYLPLYVLYGLASNVFRVSIDSLFLRGEREPGRYGLYMGSRMAAVGVGTLACGLLLAEIDFPRTLLWLAAGIAALGLLLPLVPRGEGRPAELSAYRRDLLGRPAALFFAGWLFLFTTHWGAEYTSYGLFLRQGLGLSLGQMGGYMAGQFAVIAASAWGAGRLLGAGAKTERLLAVGLLASGAGGVLMVHPEVAVSFLFRAVHETGDGLVSVIMYVRLAELFRTRRIGGHLGLMQVVMTLGTTAGALVYGPVGERFGYWLPLVASGGLTLALVPLSALWERRLAAQAVAAATVGRLPGS